MYIGQTRSPLMVILLTIITCGIYGIYWYFTIIQDLNESLGQERVSMLVLVLCIICGPAAWYLLYKVDEGLTELSVRENFYYKPNNFIMWLLLSLLCGVGSIVAIFQITDGYNALWEVRRNRLSGGGQYQ